MQCDVDFPNVGLGFYVPETFSASRTATPSPSPPSRRWAPSSRSIPTSFARIERQVTAGRSRCDPVDGSSRFDRQLVVIDDGPVLTKTEATPVQGGAHVKLTSASRTCTRRRCRTSRSSTRCNSPRTAHAGDAARQTSLPVIATLAPKQSVPVDARRPSSRRSRRPIRNEVTAIGSPPAITWSSSN